MNKIKDMAGQVWGRLTVLAYAGKNNDRKALWRCMCSCGTETTASGKGMRSGHTTSCGCAHRDMVSRTKPALRHGLSHDRRYLALLDARRRAKKKGWPFALTQGTMPEIPHVCPVLGVELKSGCKLPRAESPSLDRIVPELGYMPTNVRFISHRANTLKRDGTPTELMRVAYDAALHVPLTDLISMSTL